MKRFILIFLLVILVLLNACSSRFAHRSFTDFTDSTELIGKNTLYVFGQLRKEESNLRIVEARAKKSLNQHDLIPKVLTQKQLDLRTQLVNYIIDYVNLLQSLIIKDYNKDISANAKRVKSNLENISGNHDDFLTKNEIAIITTLTSALTETLTASANHAFILKIMKQQQPLLENVIARLKKELELTQIMVNNFFDRQFILVVKLPWPEKETKSVHKERERLAKLGVKILQRKAKLDSIMTDLIQAIEIIPATHKRLRRMVKTRKGGPVRVTSQLVNYGARLEESFQDYKKEEKKEESK